MAKLPKKHLEIPKVAMATSHVQEKQMGFDSNLYTHIICVHYSNKGKKSAENAVKAYLSGTLANKGGSVAILSNNGIEFKNKALNEACDQPGIKRLFSSLFHLQGNSRIENSHNFLKLALPSF